MSIVYSIEEDRGIAFAVWEGLVTAAEWLTHVRHLVADPKWPPSRALHLSDLRSARLDPSIDKAALSEAALLFGSHQRIDGLKAAIVAGDAYEQARMFEDLIARHRAIVIAFNSLSPACYWLGVDANHAERTLTSLRLSNRNAP
jgi:hypothetical protein